jgi:hypothetical protein
MLAAIAAAYAAIPAKAAASVAGHAVGAASWWGAALVGAVLGLAVVGAGTAYEVATRHERARQTEAGGATPHGNPSSSIVVAEQDPLLPLPVGALAPPGSREERQPVRSPLLASPAPTAQAVDAPKANPLPDGSITPGVVVLPRVPTREQELEVLREAQRALHAGRPDEAAQVLDRFDAIHRGGAFEEERRAARILAACAARDPSAHAEAERFLRERPASPLRGSLATACSPKATP